MIVYMKYIKLFESWLKDVNPMDTKQANKEILDQFEKVNNVVHIIVDLQNKLKSFGVADSEGDNFLRLAIVLGLQGEDVTGYPTDFCAFSDSEDDVPMTVKYTDLSGKPVETTIENGEGANNLLMGLVEEMKTLALPLASYCKGLDENLLDDIADAMCYNENFDVSIIQMITRLSMYYDNLSKEVVEWFRENVFDLTPDNYAQMWKSLCIKLVTEGPELTKKDSEVLGIDHDKIAGSQTGKQYGV
jgi:hypothetical protein